MELNQVADTLLSSTVVNTATTGSKLTLYTVSAGKSCVVRRIVVRNPSAPCANCTVFAFGFTVSSGTVGDWKASLSMANLTTATTGFLTYDLVTSTQAVIGTATQVFGIWIGTSTATATVTVDVFGYLF